MIDFSEYKDALEFAKRYFTEDLKELEITSIQIFGSSTYEEGFVKGISDIDICVFTDKMYTMDYQKIIECIVQNTKVNFIDKKPSIVIDYIADRIEFYLNHPQIALDITIMAPELPNSNNMEETVVHDAVDILVGSLYQCGIPLMGEIPQKQKIEQKFFPFYEETLRKSRLEKLVPRISKANQRIKLYVEQRNPDIADYLYKSRTYFLKWLFIYKRKYPVNLYKHLHYQLVKNLYLSENEVEKILFIGEGDIFKIASEYLEISKYYLEKYNAQENS